MDMGAIGPEVEATLEFAAAVCAGDFGIAPSGLLASPWRMKHCPLPIDWFAKAAVCLALAASFSPALAAESARPDGPWIQLFNGTNLDGWTPKITGYPLGSNYNHTFRVEDGLLKVRYDGYTNFTGQFGHLFWQDKLSNYVLRVEYRFVGQQTPGGPGWAFRNSGVMIHGEDPKDMELKQDFPTSIEVQLLGGPGQGTRHTANLCSPGTHVVMDGKLIKQHCVDSSSKTYHGDQWVTVEIEARGSQVIKHIVDGQTVLSYTLPQLDDGDGHAKKLLQARGGVAILDGGSVSLQSESHPLDFRKVELLRLNPQP